MALFKIIYYVGGFAALGYGALKFTELNEHKLLKELAPSAEPATDAEKKKKLMMEVLKNAADNKKTKEHYPTSQQHMIHVKKESDK